MTKRELLAKYGERAIFSAAFPDVKSLPCLIHSPYRVDNHPSLSIFVDEGRIYFKDHADHDSKGSLLDLLCKCWNCSLKQALDNICSLMANSSSNGIVNDGQQVKVLSRKEADLLTEIQVSVRKWEDYDKEYWESYGVTRKWLRYAEVYPISHKIVIRKKTPDDPGKRLVFPADKHAYCFVERKEGKVQIKIYQPFNKQGHKWCSKMDHSVIGLWSKVPKTGDKLVICSSLKDALCISCQLHIPAICLQGEGYGMSQKAVDDLKRRYKDIYVSFDVDKAGIEGGRRLAGQTGFKHIVPDLGKEKDYSDYYKSLEDKKVFQELKSIFN